MLPLTATLRAAVLVLAEREGEAAIGKRIDPVKSPQGDLETAVELRLGPAFTLTGRVADTSGAAIADAQVTLRLAWTEDPAVFVRPFSVTRFVEGESHDITKVERWPVWQRSRDALGLEIIDTLAALQRVDWRGTDLEGALGPAGSAAERAAGLVDKYLQPLIANLFWFKDVLEAPRRLAEGAAA